LSNREIVILCNENSPFCTQAIFSRDAEQLAQEDRECVEEGFPKLLVQKFRGMGLSLWRVPTVSYDNFCLSGFMVGENGPTVVRSTTVHGQPALAWYVRGNSNEDVPDARKIHNLIKDSSCFTCAGGSGGHSWNASSTDSGLFYTRDFKWDQIPKDTEPFQITSGVVKFKSIRCTLDDSTPSKEVPQIEPPKFVQPPEVELQPSKKK